MGLMNTLCCTPDLADIDLNHVVEIIVIVHAWPPNISIVKTDFVHTHPSKDICTEKVVKLKVVHWKDFKQIF